MKIIQSSDYRIYVDDVRVDPYVKHWTASCGLRASDATATFTMYRTKKLEQWKGYLAQVRIFARNIFSGKFGIIFEGEIVNRGWGDQRSDVGEIVFSCKGFYHWLDIPIPLLIGDEDTFNYIQRFRYEAQNINIDEVTKFWLNREEMLMKDLNLQQVVDKLFELMNSGYYLYDDSTFAWASLKNRFKIMGDIIPEFRSQGYLDAFTFVRSTQIDSFYVYLNQILTQMMFEFYQDRDGSLRIKNPSWSDDILKAHVFDEAVVLNASGFNDWANEPTRVLVVGGESDISKYTAKQIGSDGTLVVPMGLYIGLPGQGQYFSQNIELQLQRYGDANNYDGSTDTDGDGNSDFYDDISSNYKITGDFGEKRSNSTHAGTDYAMKYVPLNSLGVDGEVTLARYGSATAGNWVIIKQTIGGQRYDFVYMHLSEINVKVGEKVKGGQKIGVTGNTGDSSGPHLHLELWIGERRASGSRAIDPHKFLQEKKKAADTGTSPTTKTEDNGKSASGTDLVTQLRNTDLKKPASIPTATQLNEIINKRAKRNSPMYNMGEAFVNAAKESGLNPVALIAFAGWESGWGSNTITNNGKYNFYSIGAIDSNPVGGAYRFDSPSNGIVAGAVWIRRNYYDRGQTSLYKMRNSKSGTHNYASDPNWDKGIAGVWSAFSNVAGTDSSASTTTTTAGSNPNASTGGYSIVTKPLPTTPSVTLPSQIKDFKPVPVDYSGFTIQTVMKYMIPFTAGSYKDYIVKRPNEVSVNLICFIIEKMSNWREKYSSNSRYGLMGLPKAYIVDKLGGATSKAYDPETNIHHATLLFSNGYKRYSNKVTFGLASLYLGDISKLEPYIQEAGAEDFSKARNYMPDDVVSFVDSVINSFCQFFGGNYIKGDPHVPISNGKPGGGVDANNDDVKDYESSYKPIMSDEERLYKVNLKVSEQLLIRYDTPTGNGGNMNADNLVQRYAKYMMQLYRAESHGVTVSLSTCMPFIRPGWNAWLEPTRRNAVFYITGVSHQGSYGNGAYSTVTGGFVRDPKSYDDIEANIFVGETSVLASDFGEVVKKADMGALTSELSAIHSQSDEIIGDARKIPTLSKIYSSAVGAETNYTTTWNNEFTSNEIDSKIKTLYSSAPAVVKKRRNNFEQIINEAADFYTKILLKTSY